PHPEYLRLGSHESDRLEAYRGLFSAHLDAAYVDEIRRATNGNFALGNDRFKDEIARMLNRRVTPGMSGRPAGRSERR
ncbi:MAG TPA: transposase, partial [Thermoanaerobaculia bacterium]|nr:transposase [Thermoanaerobaculia bacterium]